MLAKALQSALLVRAVAASFVEIEKAHAVRINQGIKEQWVAGTQFANNIELYARVFPGAHHGIWPIPTSIKIFYRSEYPKGRAA